MIGILLQYYAYYIMLYIFAYIWNLASHGLLLSTNSENFFVIYRRKKFCKLN